MTWKLLKANLQIALTYRANLYAGIISSFLWMGLSLFSISILTYQAPEIGGWNRNELFVVQAIYSIILGMMYFLVVENLKQLTRLVHSGQLDAVLTKPCDSQFLVSIGKFSVYQLVRVLNGIILLVYALSMLKIESLSFMQILGFLVFTIVSIVIIYSIWFMLTTLSIWLVNLFNLYELFIHLTGIARYPLEILRYLSTYLEWVLLPLVVVSTVPAQALLQRIDSNLAMWGIILAGVLFYISRKFWQFALRFYTSASS